MKRGYYEKPGKRYAWAIANRRGFLLSTLRNNRRALIESIEADFGGTA